VIIAGIDYSMTSPAICFFNIDKKEFKFDNCQFYFLTQNKKYETNSKNITGNYFEYKNEMERFDLISSYFIDKILMQEDSELLVYLEGYSMGSRGKVLNIAENVGILKYRLWNFHVFYETVPPTVIKKFATDKGNADKQMMQDFFEKESNVKLKEVFSMTKKQWNPSSDLIDAYYICKYGVHQIVKRLD